MSERSKIEWTSATWNPIVGYSKVSDGCLHCYAERIALRFGWSSKPWTSQNAAHNVQMRPDRLILPMQWQKPRLVFVNSMGDLFHEQIGDEYIDQIFAVMLACPRHTFQVLTKRAARMEKYLNSPARAAEIARQYNSILGHWPKQVQPRNVWIGVTAEDQRRADERIPCLLETKAAIRFVSCEPLLGPIDLTCYLRKREPADCYADRPAIDWVIVGGETGPGARPMNPDWVRQIRDQCAAARAAFFFKRWNSPLKGRLLDGAIYSETPGAGTAITTAEFGGGPMATMQTSNDSRRGFKPASAPSLSWHAF